MTDRDRPDPLAQIEGKLEETLKLHRWAPKDESSLPSIENLLDALEAHHNKQGEMIAQLRAQWNDEAQVMHEASELIMRMLRTHGK